jgi:hypothetical protein
VSFGESCIQTDFRKWVNAEKLGLSELDGRIHDWIVLKKPSTAEMEQVARMNGVTNEEKLKELTSQCFNYRTLNHRVIDYRIATMNKEMNKD